MKWGRADRERQQSFGAASGSAWRSAGIPVRTVGLLSAVGTAVAAGGAAAGVVSTKTAALLAVCVAALVICAGALMVIAIPVTEFTRVQGALADKGREMATSIEDIRAIMEGDAAAFDIVFRRLRIGRVRPDQPMQPGTPATHRNAQLPASAGLADRAIEEPRPRGRRHLPRPEDRDVGTADANTPPPATVPAFWPSLTPAEQRAVMARARSATFAAGTLLCRQGQPADQVIIIRSGRAKVYVEHPAGNRDIAERGPGDIIGERAVLMIRSRSASVVALNTLQALVIPAEDFAVFLGEHPRVNAVLELQVYQRLAEDNGRSAGTSLTSWTGQICPILLSDITAFGSPSRNDEDRRALRRWIYDIVPEAFEMSNVSWLDCYWEDRGDGTLIIVPPTVPAGLLVDAVVGRLATMLRQHNHRASDATRIQLRVALHVGPVTRDPAGMSGQAIVHAARLVEAKALKRQLNTTGADLGFIASTFVYDNVIRHLGSGSSGTVDYRRVRFRSKESMITGWMHLAGARADSRLGELSRPVPWTAGRGLLGDAGHG